MLKMRVIFKVQSSDTYLNERTKNGNAQTIFLCENVHIVIVMKTSYKWIVPQFLNLRPKMAKSIVYVTTLITNRNHAFHCLN